MEQGLKQTSGDIMGWEIAKNEVHHGTFKRWCFFCNTADKAFGDVFFLNDCYSQDDFYEAWGKVNESLDPRTLSEDDLWQAILRMKAYFGEDMEEYQ